MDKKSLNEIRGSLIDAADRVDVSAVYRHGKTGNLYRVEGFSVLEATNQVMVRYIPLDSSDIEFCRPVGEFIEDINIDKRILPRFERADGD